jgi:hypothetical protein
VKKILPTVALSVVATIALAGCASNNDAAVKDACQDKVSPAVVAQWETNHADAPFDVFDAHSTKVTKGSESTSDVSVFYVSGTATLHADHRDAKHTTVHWSCFAQYQNSDAGDVSAAMRAVHIG